MTAICGGGTSAPKPGVAEFIIGGAGYLATLLERSPNPWLIAAAPLLGVISYDAIAGCSTDPPALPSYTDAEVQALLNLSLGDDFNSALEKLRDTIFNTLWYLNCACTSGPQPTAPALVPPPAAISQPSPGSNCGSLNPAAFHMAADLDWHWLIGNGTTTGTDTAWVAIPTGATSVICTVHETTADAITNGISETLLWRNSAGGLISGTNTAFYDGGFAPAGTGPTKTLAVPAGSVKLAVRVVNASVVTQTHDFTEAFEFLCGTSDPNTPAAPCCPPDPTITAMIQQIWDQVNLIQRQIVPFAYVPGTVHAGLSGAGALSISGILGVKVAITSSLTGFGSIGTSPEEHFGLGHITFGTADGFPSSYRLHRNPQILLPARCSVYTDLDYDLTPGIIVTVTELLREP